MWTRSPDNSRRKLSVGANLNVAGRKFNDSANKLKVRLGPVSDKDADFVAHGWIDSRVSVRPSFPDRAASVASMGPRFVNRGNHRDEYLKDRSFDNLVYRGQEK